MKRSVLGYLMLACAAFLAVIAVTGSAHRYLDVAFAALLAVAGGVALVQERRAGRTRDDAP